VRDDYDEVYQVEREEAAEQLVRAEELLPFAERFLRESQPG